jgi:hypothetical protein
MNAIHTLTKTDLLWRQSKFGVDRFELYQGDRQFADIRWPRLLSDIAVARIVGRKWIFNRKGWLRDRIVAAESVTRKVEATFEFDCSRNGSLKLANGRTFQWYCTKTFGNAYALVEKGHLDYLEIEHGHHWFSQRAWVEVKFRPDDLDLPLLLCLVMYLLFCINQDTAAAVAAATSVTAFG